jgi:hypothetical protein
MPPPGFTLDSTEEGSGDDLAIGGKGARRRGGSGKRKGGHGRVQGAEFTDDGVMLTAPTGNLTVPRSRPPLRHIYPGVKHHPAYPLGYQDEPGSRRTFNVNNQELLEQLRKHEPGVWQKVIRNGHDLSGNQVSLHYFESPSGQVFDFWVQPYWSTF